MALIKCSECGHQMSDQTKQCPHCGYPNPFDITERGWLRGYSGGATSVKIPDSVNTILISALKNSRFEEIIIPKSVKDIGYGAFRDCRCLRKVKFSEGLEKLGSDVFFGCEHIEHIKLPSTITELGSYYNGMKSLKEIVIPENVKELSTSSLFKDNSLHINRIIYNAKKCSISGYRNDLNPISAFGAISVKEFIIGDKVEMLPDLLFVNLTINHLRIPSNVKTIKGIPSNSCQIDELEIEKGVEEVEFVDLFTCSKNIRFLGNIEEFRKIKIYSLNEIGEHGVVVECDDGTYELTRFFPAR